MSDNLLSIIANVSETIQQYTYPLLKFDAKGFPGSFASCVFMNVDGQVYLVTAAHALRGNNSGLLTRGNGHLVDLAGHATISRSDLEDEIDIGALLMDNQIVQEQQFRVVPDLMLSSAVEVTDPHARAISGFPVSMNKQINSLDKATKTVTGKCYTYVGHAEFNRDFREFNKSPEVHIGLELLPGNDDVGRFLSTLPSPRGVSGGGAWLIPDLSRPSLIFLEGVLIECHKRGKSMFSFSTRLEHVIEWY